MKKISKMFVALIVLLGAGHLGASFWIGNTIEQEWHRQAETLSSQYPGIKFEIASYEKSLFSSSASTKITIAMLATESKESPSITLTSNIQHGPLIFDNEHGPALLLMQSQTSLTEIPDEATEIAQKIPELLQITAQDRVTFGWQYTGQIAIPAFKKEFTEGEDVFNVQFDGMTADLSGELKPQMTIKLDLTMPKFAVEMHDGSTANMNNISLSADLHEVVTYLYEGTTAIQIESFTMNGPTDNEDFQVELDNLEISADIDVIDEMLREVVTYRIDKLQINQEAYGPANLEVVMSNLDAQALSDIQKEFQQIQLGLMTDPETINFGEQQLDNLKNPILSILQKSPKLEIRDFEFQTPHGKVVCKGQCLIDGSQVKDFEQPLLLIGAIAANMDVSIDKPLLQVIGQQYVLNSLKAQELPQDEKLNIAAQQAESTIAGLASANMLVDAGETYQLQAEFNQGSLLVNGQKMP